MRINLSSQNSSIRLEARAFIDPAMNSRQQNESALRILTSGVIKHPRSPPVTTALEILIYHKMPFVQWYGPLSGDSIAVRVLTPCNLDPETHHAWNSLSERLYAHLGLLSSDLGVQWRVPTPGCGVKWPEYRVTVMRPRIYCRRAPNFDPGHRLLAGSGKPQTIPEFYRAELDAVEGWVADPWKRAMGRNIAYLDAVEAFRAGRTVPIGVTVGRKTEATAKELLAMPAPVPWAQDGSHIFPDDVETTEE